MPKSTMSVLVACLLGLVRPGLGAEQGRLPLIPWPKTLTEGTGNLALEPSARIVVASKDLLTLGDLLADDIFRMSGIRLGVAQGAAAAGEIGLAIDPSLAGEQKFYAHTVKVADAVEIRGADYAAVVHGTASLLQTLTWDGKRLSVPKFALADHSVAPFVGIMLDVARNHNSLEVVKDCMRLCRLYKLRYLHLHLTDDHAAVFPSRAFPKIGSSNRKFWDEVCEVYNIDEFRDVVRFGEQRGVTIIPEFEGACHSDAIRIAHPETFDCNNGGAHMGIIDMSNPAAYKGFATLFAEACDLFSNTPYIHFGNDEPWALGRLNVSPMYKAFIEKHGLKNEGELWNYWVGENLKSVQNLNRKMIVWQDSPLPKGVVVMQWHIDWGHGGAEQVAAQGYEVIQVTWTPCIYSSVEEVYRWSPYSEIFPPGPKNLGSEMLLWEMPGRMAIPLFRYKAPPRNERTYAGPDVKRDYKDFAKRLRETDRVLDRLLTGIGASEQGADPIGTWLDNNGAGAISFEMPFKVALETACGSEIHYTLDGKDPTRESPRYDKPIDIGETAPGSDKATLKARAFERSGDAFGGILTREYVWNPLRVKVEGVTGSDGNRFGPTGASVTVEAVARKGSVRYVLRPKAEMKPDVPVGEVKPDSPAVQGPIQIKEAAFLKLRYFGDDGKPRGAAWEREFTPAEKK